MTESCGLPQVAPDARTFRALDHTITEVRAGFADMPPEALEALIAEAVAAASAAVPVDAG